MLAEDTMIQQRTGEAKSSLTTSCLNNRSTAGRAQRMPALWEAGRTAPFELRRIVYSAKSSLEGSSAGATKSCATRLFRLGSRQIVVGWF
jgi:hypothetical protein